MSDFLHCPAVLALELAPDSTAPRRVLQREEASHVAALLADDLRRLLPGAEHAHLACAGALFDAAQLLRPGFPVFAALGDLADRAAHTATSPQVIAFGAHDRTMPLPALQPLDDRDVGPMLFVPWSLFGPPTVMQQLGERMEHEFLARGEAGVELADLLMRTLGLRFEHARLLTRHDLCALTCVQLEHAGFAAVWEVLETALLTPQSSHSAMSLRGRVWHWENGVARTASPGFAAWLALQGTQVEPAQRAHEWVGALFELRLFMAILGAHAVPVVLDGVEQVDGGAIETLAPMDPQGPAPRLFAHAGTGLGTVAFSVTQSAGHVERVIAHAYPLGQRAHETMCALLAQRYGCGALPHVLGRVVLDEASASLTVPGAA